MEKIVFITGGTGGIGSALVKAFAGQGCQVLFTYRKNASAAKQLADQYATANAYQCDVLQAEEVEKTIREVLKKYSKVDILINNAGIMRDKTFMKMDKKEWDMVIDVNLKSVFAFTKAFIPGMASQKFGRIINIASVAGLKGFFGKTNYSASKAGLLGFTRSLALELATKGITVNALAPGLIDTEMIAEIPEKYMTDIIRGIPLGRLGQPEEVAAAAAFLAAEQSAYITGEVITIGGGL